MSELYYQASRNIYLSNNSRKIPVTYKPSTYLGRVGKRTVLYNFRKPTKPYYSFKATLDKETFIHFTKCIAKEENINDHYGSMFV